MTPLGQKGIGYVHHRDPEGPADRGRLVRRHGRDYRWLPVRLTQAPPGPVYLNVVAVSADPFKRGRAGDSLEVTGGQCEVVRFAPELFG